MARNISDALGNEIIGLMGFAVTRVTAYRVNRDYFGNSPETCDYVAFGPFAKIVSDNPADAFSYDEVIAEISRMEASADASYEARYGKVA